MNTGKAPSMHFESQSTFSIWSRLIMLLLVVLVPLMLIQFYFLYDQEFPQHPQTAYLQGIELKSFAHASKKFSL